MLNKNNLKKQLVKHEGLRLKVYKCTANKLTIGIGRNLEDNGITEQEAMLMLDNDIEKIYSDLNRRFSWFNIMTPNRQEVVINMVFNLGIGGFLKFKNTIHFLASSQYEQAAIEMLESKWASQVGRRAKELSKIMMDG